ncbi:hypothetical protein F7725_008484 [Dissostichus mawsoni]|uniref:Zinc transporter ZIP9 n=1 Tax=Dissostichus mawsoni TaxID=36200 RepID=A0A7J5Y8M5_DISMA|nr:hypothetical protein F7725_008484 [Dissostichus mawsoni]
MDDFSSISLLSLAMLVGCYVAGTIPLAVNFSEEKLKLVTVLGAGLLCGTALAVIIPEGVHALYEEILEGRPRPGGVVEVSEAKGEVDVSAGGKHEHSTRAAARLHRSLSGARLRLHAAGRSDRQRARSQHRSFRSRGSEGSSKITTTLGLVVHAAADGVALGAAASTSQTSSSKEALSDFNATGVAMLFSAGTFLYVATVHVLPEVGGGHSHSPAGGNGGKGLSKVEVGALVLGCLIPLVLSVGHHH